MDVHNETSKDKIYAKYFNTTKQLKIYILVQTKNLDFQIYKFKFVF